jgi:PadR family transcriptional regulator PadR
LKESNEISQWVAKEVNNLILSSHRVALLSIIHQSGEEGIYGYKIGEKLVSATDGELDGSKATFYAILRRFEKEQLIKTELKISTTGPARKYYFLSEKGELAYNALWQNWVHYFGILKALRNKTGMNWNE